jgi:Nucleotidyltransferase/DNA polymerase involved in DNA repair
MMLTLIEFRYAQTRLLQCSPCVHRWSNLPCLAKNKPDGQFHLPFDSGSIIAFMRDLSIRKVPGIGRVNERLLESIGIKVNSQFLSDSLRAYLDVCSRHVVTFTPTVLRSHLWTNNSA